MKKTGKVILGVILGVVVLKSICSVGSVGSKYADRQSSPSETVVASTSSRSANTGSAGASIVDALLDPQMDAIHDKVVRDAIDQYNLVQKGGDKIQICVYAGMVSAATIQAKDEAGFAKWKAIERQDCKRAGMPK